jgi:proteic killer suppression protein
MMAAPSLNFHPLKGSMKGRFAVTVHANWRITFGWDDGDAIAVDSRTTIEGFGS